MPQNAPTPAARRAAPRNAERELIAAAVYLCHERRTGRNADAVAAWYGQALARVGESMTPELRRAVRGAAGDGDPRAETNRLVAEVALARRGGAHHPA